MKDFNQLLDNQNDQKMSHYISSIKTSHDDDFEYIQPEQTLIQKANKYIIKYAGSLALCLLTGPFNTSSVLMQISDKPLVNELQKKIQHLGKDNKYVKNGIYGDNKIYKSSQISSYNDCFTKIGKQGIRGMYKGNFSAALLILSNTKLRGLFYSQSEKYISISEGWKKNLIAILTCSLADLLTLPIMLCQSRLVLQSSLDNFRTYKNPLQVLRKTTPKMWFSGSSLLLLKNVLFTYSWLTFIKDSPVYSFILSTVLSHIVTYPFMTVIRQLQCNEKNTPMMNDREEKVRQCVRRIWNKLGIRGFYRGFIGYGLVHTFLGIIIVEMNMRKGYFVDL